MKFCNLLLYDLRQGILKPWTKLIPLIALVVVALIGANRYYAYQGILLSSGECLAYLFLGDFPYSPNSSQPFKVPLLWFLIQIYLPYYLGNYPTNDLKGVGKNTLLKVNGRKIWWIGKVIWAIIGCLLYMALLTILCFLFGLLNKQPTFAISSDYIDAILMSDAFSLLDKWQLIYIIVLPLLAMVSLSLLQLMLNFAWRPFCSLVIVVSLYVATAYMVSPYLPSSYSMLLRNQYSIQHGVSGQFGIPYLCICSVAFATMGYFVFSHYDILDNSKEV